MKTFNTIIEVAQLGVMCFFICLFTLFMIVLITLYLIVAVFYLISCAICAIPVLIFRIIIPTDE